MFFLIFGDDTYRSQKKLKALRNKFGTERDPSGLNQSFFCYHKTDDLGVITEAIFSSPFLSTKKLVILEGYLTAEKKSQEEIIDLLNKKPDGTIIIFFQGDSRETLGDSPLLTFLLKEKFTEEFKPLAGVQLNDFIIKECFEAGLRIEIRAVQLLAELFGKNSWLLHSELEKLKAIVKVKNLDLITPRHISQISDARIEDSVFSFLDACIQGHAKEAEKFLEDLITNGTNELLILATLIQQIRSLLGVKDLVSRNVTDRFELARQLGAHPFFIGKALKIIQLFKLEQLKKLFSDLIVIEQKIKTGSGCSKAEMSLFTCKISPQIRF